MRSQIKEHEGVYKTLPFILKRYFEGSKYAYKLCFFEIACRFAERNELAKTQHFFLAFLHEYRQDDEKIIELLKTKSYRKYDDYVELKMDLIQHGLVVSRIISKLEALEKHGQQKE
jgi:hypothetical protein